MILSIYEKFAVILFVCVFVAWGLGYQWALVSYKKEEVKNNER